jgi:hypothetical protein
MQAMPKNFLAGATFSELPSPDLDRLGGEPRTVVREARKGQVSAFTFALFTAFHIWPATDELQAAVCPSFGCNAFLAWPRR